MILPSSEHRRFRGTVRRRDEGVVWARGWDTPAANALRTAIALGMDPMANVSTLLQKPKRYRFHGPYPR